MLAIRSSVAVRPAARRCAAPPAVVARPSRSSLRCRAEQAPVEPTPAAPKPATDAPATATAESVEVKKVEATAPLLQKGQGTAIVTGAISAVLGIGYLVLVWMLDSRGGQLLPPPPEAFIP